MREGLAPKDRQVIGLQRQTARLHMALQARTIANEVVSGSTRKKLPATADYNDPQKLLTAYKEFRTTHALQIKEALQTDKSAAENVQEKQALVEQKIMREEILNAINDSNFFSPQTIRQGVQSEGSFSTLLRTVVEQVPEIALVIPDVLFVTVPTEFKSGLEHLRENSSSSFDVSFGDVARFYSQHEIKEIMQTMTQHAGVFFVNFFTPDVLSCFIEDGKPTDEAIDLSKQAFMHGLH